MYGENRTNKTTLSGDGVGPADNLATSLRSVPFEVPGYDWEADQPLRRPMKDMIL
jgi:hypothetical protein